jgi:GT2 family glycosyltransferase
MRVSGYDSMHWFLKTFIIPLLDALRPGVIVEVGVELGTVTGPLLEWARAHEALVHSIDPNPKLEVDELLAEHPEHLRFHRAPSLEVLSEIAAVELALIDGDHNWYTVVNELRQLEQRAIADGRCPPAVLLHDIGWPYGRRDLYYDPESIPVAHRQPHARLGMIPGQSELTSQGANGHLANAQLEGTPANGVLSAIEDFIAESEESWRFFSIPGLSGLGVLLSAATCEDPANGPLRELLRRIDSAEFLRAQCDAIESARLESEVRRARLLQRLDETATAGERRQTDLEETCAKLSARLDVARAEAGDARRTRDLLGEELAKLKVELNDDRQAAARLQHELEATRRERDELTFALAQFHARDPAAPAWERELEQRGRQALLDAYLPLLSQAALGHTPRDPLSFPLPADRRGLLCATGEAQEPGKPNVDVVVCVHDALEDVRRCLCSLLDSTDRRFRLILVDDGSAVPTASFLADLAARYPAVTLVRRAEPPHGYTLAANVGLRTGVGDYVVLLNSDAVVTPEWLGRLVDYGERHPQVGILGPLSNAASHQSVPALRDDGAWATNPLPNWLTVDGMAMIVARAAPRVDARLPFVNGFCYVVKRRVVQAIGEFDEKRFAAGYCEENDYSHRAYKQGFGLAVVDDVYVHHAKSRSYGNEGRSELAKRHYEAFLDKHDREELQELVRSMEADTALEPVRQAVARGSANPAALAALLTGGERTPLHVVFILPGLADGGSGGSHSIYQEVKGMRELGIPAHIALHAKAWDRARAAYEDAEEIFRVFTDTDELAAVTAQADVISATHFKSVALLRELRERRQDFLPAYYVQDYEPFFSASDGEDLHEAVASYTALPDAVLFAKTHWLCNVVGALHGVPVERVEPSIDERLFRSDEPGVEMGMGMGMGMGMETEVEIETEGSEPVRVIAMVRPRTRRRQPFSTVTLLERLLAELPAGQIEVRTFGCRHLELARLTRSRAILDGHLGVLGRAAVAKELRRSDVFLDMSMYQAFGRSALEAMACGATAVVPQLGGAWEFIEDGRNALAVDTLDQNAAFDALASLLGERARLAQMRAAARATGSRYSIVRAALSEYLLFEREHRRRFGATSDLEATSERQCAYEEPVAVAAPLTTPTIAA